MTPQHVPCRECGGHLQRIASMPGHLVCGSGHLFLESDVTGTSPSPSAPSSSLQRVGGDRRHAPEPTRR